MAALPTPELAPFWMNHAPLPTSSGRIPSPLLMPALGPYALRMRYAVLGFTEMVAACVARSPSLLIFKTSSMSATACVLHVPNWAPAGMTQSPLCTGSDESPVATTSKTPSFPGIADGLDVPMREVKLGWEP
ncbi:hypothetical protein TgHK011_009086 [Trichoderma gracile]|nr:hypothetical protein TgHK011_009086 [Trichoderma gracile]